jgi:hypothetical protein
MGIALHDVSIEERGGEVMWVISFSVVLTFIFAVILTGYINDKINGKNLYVGVFWFSLVAFLGYMAGQS